MIQLHIKCLNGSARTEELENLGIKVKEETEYRPFRIRPETIIGFYPDTDGGCFLMVGEMELCVKESFDEMREKLKHQ